MITEEKIKKTLSQIIDPELGTDIVTLGFVKNIKIKNNQVTIELKLTSPGCPLMNLFLKEIKEKIEEFEEVSGVEIKLVN